jgi:predicted O-methyltransferase YrrM
MLNLRPPSRYQDQEELRQFVEFCQARNVRRYLEIGSRWGDSFYAVMANLPIGSFGVSIDQSESAEKYKSLMATVGKLRAAGQDVLSLSGNSRDRAMVDAAKLQAPFDLVFIDGDHTLPGVKADWQNYHWLAPMVAVHDIAAPDDWMSDGKSNGVGKFWRELKASAGIVRMSNPSFGIRETIEFVTPGSNMGYGIVVR